ncbi:hypothetical protein SAMN04488066_10870 [Halorubrum aquaticum]|uniref:SipW-cognate class signal peptide n=1 Tax=Halorubrum aquaticum TaxID=387340 RepID=A0A1I3AZG2_9EURY|nr:hypothetical protein [Halorubrum aquaticum]SFH55362.1 hypothetical protein SAMN04488066_10870 [Halorubrum aquaticum]
MTGAFRTLATGLLAVGLVFALVGTGGFSSAMTDREVTVATAADERAFVGYDSPDEIAIGTDGNATNGGGANRSETVTLVTVTNRFDVEVDVTEVDVDEKPDDLNVTVRPPPSDVSPGESGSEAVVAELECADAFEAERLSVTVRLRGNGVEAVVFGDTESRTISVTCRTGS